MTVGQNVNAMANGKMVVSTQTILAGEDGVGGHRWLYDEEFVLLNL